MSLSRRSFALLAAIFAAVMLGALVIGSRPSGAPVSAAAAPARPQPTKASPPAKAPQPPARTIPPLKLGEGQEIIFTTPQFKVEAMWFKANDETGWAWMGSDEVYAVFSDMDPTHIDRTTSIYQDVDEGDTVNFKSGDTCMAPQPNCDKGMSDLNVRFAFWESDWAPPLDFSICINDYEGAHWRLTYGTCDVDDFIGRGSIIYSRDELVAMLPAVGNSREFTAVMDQDAGKYRFHYRITRIANAERSIVIHLPPIEATPMISLQASVVTIQGTTSRVDLTWSGATTATVDIYRNGAKIVTTANNGAYSDVVTSGTYQYSVCNLGSTTGCSPQVAVTAP
jgi:hypothetical protein